MASLRSIPQHSTRSGMRWQRFRPTRSDRTARVSRQSCPADVIVQPDSWHDLLEERGKSCRVRRLLPRTTRTWRCSSLAETARTRIVRVARKSRRFSRCYPTTYSRGSTTRQLADFDEMIIGISNVGSDFDTVVFRFGQKVGASRGPLAVCLMNVSHSDVHEGAREIRIGWRRERNGWLVVSWTAADVENDPAVRHLQNDWVPFPDDLSIKY